MVNCFQRGDTRAETRREQILDAAMDCFSTDGFHGASIAKISKAAQMSVGHIYHYFENKEAIIAAIVDRDLQRVLEIATDLINAENPLETMIDTIDRSVAVHLHCEQEALNLEILAEAARNPKIAAMVRDADEKARASFMCATRAVLEKNRVHKSDIEIATIVDLMGAIFNGLTIRSISNPHIDRDHMVRLVNGVIRYMVEAPSDSTN